MFLVASSLLAHWFFNLRGHDPLLASSLCLVYTTIGTMILSVIFTSLIQGEYPFRRRLMEIARFTIYLVVVLAINYLFIPQRVQYFTLIAVSLFFVVITVRLTMRFFKVYRETVNRADNYYSENVGNMLKWIPTTIYAIILLVLISAILSVASNISFISLDLFFGLSLFTYVFISLQNYMINIAKMKMLLLTSEQSNTTSDSSELPKSETIEIESRESKAVKQKLDKWIEGKGFTKHGLTLDDLALELNTNRTYISSYINTVYHLTFRGYIASQRLAYSKKLLLQSEELPSATIAVMVGYSPNAFIKIFTKAEGMPPVQWRGINKGKMVE